ncbi:Yip1 family protein [Shouchella lonarensis]|uniref:Yip1 domain-containing protein n=1 Tax=Shouchella lonarensis TaxID=1464122 RepID=A0A1G6H151_9BACI|nr:Yip1 family protein [Shouchella lonarensis]SDB87116.1 Yip1 domain-containing protein [Shouchella lonarensis]
MNTWLNIWVRPRQVMKQELEKARIEERRWQLFWIAFASSALVFFVDYDEMFIPEYRYIMISTLISGLVGALFWIFVIPWVYKWVGSWLGGKGSVVDLRIAVVNSYNKPMLIVSALCVPFILVIGEKYFLHPLSPVALEVTYTPMEMIVALLIGIINIVGLVWSIVINLHGIGEAHQFSAWKSLLMCVIVFAFVLVLVLAIGLPLGFFR